MKMEHLDLENELIRRLSKGENSNDVILDLCQKTGMKWPEVEAIYKGVISDHKGAIARRQSPLLFFLALLLFLIGFGLAGYAGYNVWATLQQVTASQADWVDGMGFVMYLVHDAPGILMLGITGAAMVAGSLLGMTRLWNAILDM